MSTRTRSWLAAAVVGVAAVGFVLVWFQPHKLVVDDRVDEPIPVAAPSPQPMIPDGVPSTAAPDPIEQASGEFVSLDHGTSGTARVLDLADGRRVLRLEDLNTSNGPDLYVYLTATPADGDEASFDDAYIDLGRLDGNIGDQNYDLPADADLARYGTVLIWCDRFDSAFGAADLVS